MKTMNKILYATCGAYLSLMLGSGALIVSKKYEEQINHIVSRKPVQLVIEYGIQQFEKRASAEKEASLDRVLFQLYGESKIKIQKGEFENLRDFKNFDTG